MDKKQPVKLRIGRITATIWENDTKNGTYYSVQFERIFKKADKWQSYSSFGRDDLLTLSKLVDATHTKIIALQTKARTAASQQVATAA